ncbi:hypothetical protein ACO0LM_01620 [Undibacterium sp. Di26W]|uniref:hypothetical protein n=1 Tax=Undibacterium sp. Di26W TaxID=3413035 RepID=UPI003BF17B1A
MINANNLADPVLNIAPPSSRLIGIEIAIEHALLSVPLTKHLHPMCALTRNGCHTPKKNSATNKSRSVEKKFAFMRRSLR